MSNEIVASALYKVASTLRGDGNSRTSVIFGNEGEWYNTNAEVAIFSYWKDFNHLWGVGKTKELSDLALVLKDRKPPLTMVVVWDEIPSGNTGAVDTTKHLTPLDWAVALSLEIHNAVTSVKDKTDQVYPDLRILILDLNSRFSSDAESVRYFRQFDNQHVKAMPWLRINTPTNDDPNWSTVNIIENMIAPANSQNPVISMRKAFEEEKPDISILCNIWRALLTRSSTPGDQHAIANLVGPLLLSGGKNEYDPNVKALRSLMMSLGLIPQRPEKEAGSESKPTEDSLLSENNPWINWKEPEWENKLGKVGGSLNLLLIDDQYPQGWGKVLCQAVRASYDKKDFIASQVMEPIGKHTTESGKNIFVKAAASANWLLDKLKDGKDQRFSFSIDPANAEGKAPEILFLDLRLFSGKNLKDEAIFIKALCGIAEKFVDNNDSKDKKNLPWLGFSSTEINQVRQWCDSDKKNQDGEDSEYIDALTFLPRILSLTDLSLPIVLFSSTGRRHISEKLKGYGNIITDFDKPKFTVDMPEDIAEQTKGKFVEAFDKAVLLLQGRHGVQKIEKAAEIKTPNLLPSGDKYVEIFIDESGNVFDGSDFVVGGLLLIHNSEVDAQRLNKAMEGTTIIYSDGVSEKVCNLVWCGPKGLPKRLQYHATISKDKTPSQKADDEAILVKKYLLEPIKKVITDNAVMALPITLRTNVSQNQNLNVLNNAHLDNIYLKLIKELLDAAIYELLPWYLDRNDLVICKIIAGTRVRTKSKEDPKTKKTEDFTPVEKQELKSNFGINVIGQPGNERYQSLTETSFIPIVSNIVFDRHDSHVININLKGAVGKTLSTSTHHTHYLADLIVHFDLMSLTGYTKSRDVFKDIFANRMVDNYDNSFKAALDASKYVEANDLVSALLSAYYAQFHHKPNKYPESIIPKILSRVSEEIVNLKGDQFIEFAGLLDVWYKNSSVPPPRKAQMDSKYPTQQLITNKDKLNNSGAAKVHSASRSNNMSKNNAPRATVLEKPNSAVPINKPLQNVQQVVITEAKTQPQNQVSVGDKFVGTISGIVKYGCFILDDKGMKGLVHESNLPNDFKQKFTVGQKLPVMVLKIDEKQRINLVLDNQSFG